MIISTALGVLTGSMLWLDRVFMFQFMVSRPIVMGFFIGLVMGDVKIGLLVGASLELLWLNAPPVGTYLPNDESFCTAAAVPAAVFAGSSMNDTSAAGLAILLSLPVALAGRSLDMHIRQINERLIPDRSPILEGDVKSAMRKAMARAFLYALTALSACTAVLITFIGLIRSHLSKDVLAPLAFMPFVCIVIGLAALVSKEMPRKADAGMVVLGIATVLLITWIL